MRDGAFVVINEVDGEDRERKHIPVGSVASIMLEPGTHISHAAVKLAAITGTLLIWVVEAAYGYTLQGNRAVHDRTSCFTRRNWLWMKTSVGRWCGRCLRCVLEKNRTDLNCVEISGRTQVLKF